MIAWKYLDKQAATVSALKDYENMTCIISLTPIKIISLGDEMEQPRSSVSDGMPRSHNVHSFEDTVISGIDKIDVLKQRYLQAGEFMKWFKPAWDTLNDEEQMILSEFYLSTGTKTDLVESLSEKLYIDRSNVYRRKEKALEHLSVLLYGY